MGFQNAAWALGAVLLFAPSAPAQPSSPVQYPAVAGVCAKDEEVLNFPDMPLHDPWIVADQASHTYYLFTRNEPAMSGDRQVGVMAYTSQNLKDWTCPKIVFSLPTGMWANDGAWAPEVHKWKGRWYLFSTFFNAADKLPANGPRKPVRRSTILAVSDNVDGPYKVVRDGAPIVDAALMTLDGTLYVDRAGKPWLVYAHEWVQVGDGRMEAIPLNDALAAAGDPILLFRASQAPWTVGATHGPGDTTYVTDGPELFRTKTERLLMLWSSYDAKGYVQGIARSASGEIQGPWEQLKPLIHDDSGHGMIFRRFDGTLMLVLHHPFRHARGRLYEISDDGNRLTVVREARDLDKGGSPLP